MKRQIPFFKLYTSYIKNHRKAMAFLQDLEISMLPLTILLHMNVMIMYAHEWMTNNRKVQIC
jgi:hypothetical protein